MQPTLCDGQEITIRDATYDDVPSILEIYNDAVLHTTASYDYEPATIEARIAWYEEHIKQGLPVFVADAGGSVVGWSTFSIFRPRIGYRFTVEHSIYVAPGRQGRGIGRALMQPLITRAREQGMHAMIAGIDAETIGSIRFHAAFGFVHVGYLKEVGYKFDHWLDLVFMQLLLK
ncbi:MAG: N-acetyltransferase [Herpetosiphonaceae bacterium]|nr:N-acetyltransferase [Herpetosiphonaceae bacterium]